MTTVALGPVIGPPRLTEVARTGERIGARIRESVSGARFIRFRKVAATPWNGVAEAKP